MMPVHTFEELNVYVIAAFVLGLIVGVIYDLFRVLRFFMGVIIYYINKTSFTPF